MKDNLKSFHLNLRFILGAVIGVSLLYAILGVNGMINWPPVRSDGEGYYAYLPMFGIYHNFDLSLLQPFYEGHLPAGARFVPETSHYHIKYPLGVAVCQSPFFTITHVLTLFFRPELADGYSLPYQLSVTLSGTFYAVLGLWALSTWLRRRFQLRPVLWTIAFTAFGTSVAHYASYDAFASHIYTFSLLCILLDQLDRWVLSPGWKRSLALGAIFGLLFCVRNYSLMFGLLFFPFLAQSTQKISNRSLAFYLVLMATAAIVTAFPQFALWHYSTGHWLSYSYGDEGFVWNDPHFFDVLLSVRKGVLFYTPGLALGLIGLVWLILRGTEKALGLFCLICVVLTYALASFWSCWPFGGSFGHRAFVDVYPLLAFGLAYLTDKALATPWQKRLHFLLALLIALNLFQMALYWCGYLKSDKNTWAEYGRAYFRPVIMFRDFQYDLRFPNNSANMKNAGELGAVSTVEELKQAAYKPSEPVSFMLHVENQGKWLWKNQGRRGGVKLMLRWLAVPEVSKSMSAPFVQRLPDSLPPGKSLNLNLSLAAPENPGDYVLEISWEITSIGITPETPLAKIRVTRPAP